METHEDVEKVLSLEGLERGYGRTFREPHGRQLSLFDGSGARFTVN